MTESHSRPKERTLTWAMILIVFAVGLSVRLLTVYVEGGDFVFSKYSDAADQLHEGTLSGARILDFSPLYLDFHRMARALSLGEPGWIRLAQGLFGALNCVLITLIASSYLSPREGLLSGLLLAFSLELSVYDQLFEPEVFLISTVLGAWVLSLRAGLLSSNSLSKPLAYFALAGLVAGAALGIRPSAWLLIPLIPFASGFRWKTRLGFIRPLLCFALGLCFVQGLVHIRNQSFGQGASMSPWQVLYTGNNPMAHGMWREDFLVKDLEYHSLYQSPDFAHQTFRDIAIAESKLESGQETDNPETYWLDLTLTYASRYPWRYLGLLSEKVLALGQPRVAYDFHQADSLSERLERWPLIPYALLFSMGIVGWALHFRRLRPLVFVAAVQASVFVVFFVSSRYRVLLLPWFCVGSAGWILTLWDGVRFRRWIHVSASVLAVLALTFVMRGPFPPGVESSQSLDPSRVVRKRVSVAEEALLDDRIEDAQLLMRDAYYQKPWDNLKQPIARIPYPVQEMAESLLPNARAELKEAQTTWNRLRLAVLLDEAGHSTQAIDAYALVLDRPWYSKDSYLGFEALIRRGILYLQSRNDKAAATEFRRALAIRPGAPRALVGIALSDPQCAEAALDQARATSPSLEIDYFHGRMALDTDRIKSALKPLERLSRALPDYSRGQLLYAIALLRDGKPDAAFKHAKHAQSTFQWLYDPKYRTVEVFENATRMFPKEKVFWVTLSNAAIVHGEGEMAIRAFRTLESLGDLDVLKRIQFGRVLLSFGHFREAITHLERALEEVPNNPRAMDGVRIAKERLGL